MTAANTTFRFPAESASQSQPARLRISEIFYSLQGESSSVGFPTTFIRLTGCPLRCNYCDTQYAFHGGEWISLTDICDRVQSFNCKRITVTGGEPLAQKTCLQLLTQLCDLAYQVSLETSGALDISQADKRVKKIVDFKTPGSGETDRNFLENIHHLNSNDEVKFVLCDREDYDWAKQFVEENALRAKCEILFSPSHENLNATTLADWVIKDQLDVRVQIQLHKFLWGNQAGR